MNNYEERLLALVELGFLGNLPELNPGSEHINSAYSDLLEQRLAPVSWQGDTQAPPLSEEDIMANTNLQTASLFKKLKSELKEASNFVELYTDQQKEVNDSLVKIETGFQSLKKMCEIYHQVGLEGLLARYAELQKEILPIKSKITEEILRRIHTKNSDIEKISTKLNSLRSIIVTGLNEIVKPEDTAKKMCPICFENEINTVLVPCGHTYCKPCSDMDRTRNAKCPQCRSQINARVKLFFTV